MTHPLPLSVYTLGPKGSFSAQGSEIFLASGCPDSLNPQIQLCDSFPRIFESVKAHPGSLGIVPLQNDSTSSIHENVDMFFQDSSLRIWAEFLLPVRLHVLGLPGTQFEDITQLHSHPKAFEQCKTFTDSFSGEIHYGKSTSALAQKIKNNGEKNVAVLGGEALIHQGLCILKPNVHDHAVNETQFVVFGVQGTAPKCFPKNSKWTVHFECHHKPGSLAQVLQLVASQGGNLMKVESRPIPNQRERFRFWLDIDATHAKSTLYEELKASTVDFHCVGQYAPGQVLDLDSPHSRISLLRRQIDSVDTDLVDLLTHRQSFVRSIAQEKEKENMPVEQQERFAEILESRILQAKKNDLNIEFVRKLYNLIHTESVSYQNDKP